MLVTYKEFFMVRATVFLTMIAVPLLVCGCEELDNLKTKADKLHGAEEIPSASPNIPTVQLDTTTSQADAIPIGSISWLGTIYAKAGISATINGASLNNDTIYTSYNPYSWPSTSVKVQVDAICCLFYERGGQIVGGKFDYWRKGGQSSKALENVHQGYNGHSFPARGSKVYTMIVSVNGSQRSNIKECSWR